jgi:hypothetical protein
VKRSKSFSSNGRKKPDPEATAGRENGRETATLVTQGVAGNAAVVRRWGRGVYGSGELDLAGLYGGIRDAADRVHRGELQDAESLLMAQATSLNTVFTTLMLRAGTATDVERFERYLRLALKAQSQCRATCEAIAMLKHPPVFAQHANIAHGNQQINRIGRLNARPRSRARIRESSPIELLEEAYGQRLDYRPEGSASGGHSTVEAVGVFDRAANGGRQGASRPKRVSGRSSTATS